MQPSDASLRNHYKTAASSVRSRSPCRTIHKPHSPSVTFFQRPILEISCIPPVHSIQLFPGGPCRPTTGSAYNRRGRRTATTDSFALYDCNLAFGVFLCIVPCGTTRARFHALGVNFLISHPSDHPSCQNTSRVLQIAAHPRKPSPG